MTGEKSLAGKRVLLIVGGGVAAYKSLETTRRLMERGVSVRVVMTRAAQEFVTPLSFASLSGEKVHTELFALTDEVEMGHIELSRSADLLLVAPATADLMAKMALGRADDLASTLLLATDAPVMAAPAMNVRMWTHPATQRNLATLAGDGVRVVGPNDGSMACGEYGPGRMAEPLEIVAAVASHFDAHPSKTAAGPDMALAGLTALVTSGPTHEPIDPVRYIANRSSGRQGAAIAEALAARGAAVRFVTGPAEARRPRGCEIVEVETAREMRDAVSAVLPVDVAVFAAAVADWRAETDAAGKIKKRPGAPPPPLALVENPDILAEVSARAPGEGRPPLVVGFAAETDDVLANARAKRLRKGCDWLVANDVSAESGVMGGAQNAVTLITEAAEESWPRAAKEEVAARLAARIVAWAEARAAAEA